MSIKKPSNPKKPTSGTVIKPLRPASKAKANDKTSSAKSNTNKDNAEESRATKKVFSRNKKEGSQGAYTSVKNRRSKRSIMSKASGASSRGGFEYDKNRFRMVWGIALTILGFINRSCVLFTSG